MRRWVFVTSLLSFQRALKAKQQTPVVRKVAKTLVQTSPGPRSLQKALEAVETNNQNSKHSSKDAGD